MRWTLPLIVGLALLYWLAAVAGPSGVGLWQDDAIYLCTAKSLAEGNGYRHPEMPGTPYQTKYPIFYPAVLALGWLVSPEYPRNVPLLLVPGALSAAVLVVVGAQYCRRVLGLPAWLTCAVGTLGALSPVVLSFVRFTMSDLPYGALAMVALYLLDRRCADGTAAKSAWRGRRLWLVLAGVDVALAVLTRGIGVSLAAAAVATLLARRRIRDAVLLALVVGGMVAPWSVWQARAARANGPMQTALLTAPELSYGLWKPQRAEQTLRTAWQNAFRTAFGLVYFQLALPREWTFGAVNEMGARTVVVHVLGYLAAALILAGLIRCMREGLRTLHLYALFYVGLMLVWPFEPYRFLIPWTPVLLGLMLHGLSWVTGAAARSRACRVVSTTVVSVVTLMLVGLFLHDAKRIVTSTEERYFLREFPVNWAEMRAAERWVAAHVPPEGIVASAQPAALFLATGRRGHYFWPDTDPYSLYYGPDRRWASLYVPSGRSEAAHLAEQIPRQLADAYRAERIGLYVEHQHVNTSAIVLAPYVRARPREFVHVHRTPRGVYNMFRVQLD